LCDHTSLCIKKLKIAILNHYPDIAFIIKYQ
jgi:hypothetical protein